MRLQAVLLAGYDRSGLSAFDNTDFVDVVIHAYRIPAAWRRGDPPARNRPECPCCMSDYSRGVLNSERIRDGELAFIQKPFTAPALLEKYSPY
jgi:hypothetical protein